MDSRRNYLQELFDEPILWVCLILICGALLISGCAHQVTATLPPGALNAFDADSYRTLADGHAAVQSLQQQAAGGTLVLTVSQKQVLNKAITDVNTADHLYSLYHAEGSGDTTALSTAIQQVVADLAALATIPNAQTAPAK
jgi:hypothetical protein